VTKFGISLPPGFKDRFKPRCRAGPSWQCFFPGPILRNNIMKLATSLLVAALALAPAFAFAKDKTTTTTTTTSSKIMSTGSVQSNKIDINTASESDLTALFSKYEKGDKAKTSAEAVISGRTYGKTADVKKVISASLYNKVKSKLTTQ
jgi:DNA uptake protein ComE-like DNA-binding protein